jgi:hypothetical protein
VHEIARATSPRSDPEDRRGAAADPLCAGAGAQKTRRDDRLLKGHRAAFA